jgi:putative inorganic carbon (hco3(-)) transporter
LKQEAVFLRKIAVFLDRWHWLLLAGVAPFLLFPSSSRSWVLLLAPVIWIIAWAAGRGPFVRTPVNTALLLLFCMVLASLWVTYDIHQSLPKICGIILGLGIFYAVAREGQTQRGWWLGAILLMGFGLGISVLGVLGTNWIKKIAFLTPIVSRLSPRITGLPGAEEGFHPNYVAGALLWVIPAFIVISWLLISKAREIRKRIGKSWALLIIFSMSGLTLWVLGVFVLTQSREGYIDLVLTLPVLILLILPSRWKRIGLISLFLIFIGLGIYLSLNWSMVSSWLSNSDLASNPAFSVDTLNGRLDIWSRAIYGIQDFPFTGMGMNTFRKLMPVLYPLFNASIAIDVGHAHNEFLMAALDLGIPGLVAFVALYIIAFWMLVRIWRGADKGASPDQLQPGAPRSRIRLISVLDNLSLSTPSLLKTAVVGLGCGLLAHLLWGMTDAMALGARPAFLFWIVLGLICGLYQQVQAPWHTEKQVLPEPGPSERKS